MRILTMVIIGVAASVALATSVHMVFGLYCVPIEKCYELIGAPV